MKNIIVLTVCIIIIGLGGLFIKWTFNGIPKPGPDQQYIKDSLQIELYKVEIAREKRLTGYIDRNDSLNKPKKLIK